MNKLTLINSLRFVVLILVQVLLLNNINYNGYIDPYIYILFILLYPLNGNRGLLLIVSFLLGLSVDIFGDSGGVHAAACVVLAYIRPVLLRSIFGISYEFQTLKLGNVSIAERFLYVTLMTITHHIILFSFEIFSLSLWLLILKKIIFCSIFTILLSMIILILFGRKDQ